MACPDDNRLVEFVDGLLAAADQREVDVHVDGCARCRELLALFTTAGARDGAALGEPPHLSSRYAILDVVGAGGMAVVYAAYDRELDRKVALKLLREHGDDHDAERTARLRREAQVMARLSHPNVLPVHDVGTFGDRLYLTAELVPGGTLATWLRSPHPWPAILSVFIQAARGLSAAHTAGITHRDFKPSNVLIGSDLRVRVADFGLAHFQGASRSIEGASRSIDPPFQSLAGCHPIDTHSLSTRTGQMIGTPAYMAPEQLDGTSTGDERSDQYAFCVSLTEALTGKRPARVPGDRPPADRRNDRPAPFEESPAANEVGSDRQRSWQKAVPATVPAIRLGGEVAELAELGLPGGAERIVRRALRRGLAREPGARHPSMEALIGELEAALGPSRRRSVVAIAAVSAIAVAGVAFAVWSRTGQRDGEAACTATGELSGRWDPKAAAALRAGFAASGHRDADAIATRTTLLLDRYAARWSAMWIDSCRATHVQHVQSPHVLDLRTRCLEARRAELGSMASALRTADRALVGRATETAQALSSLDECADVARLESPLEPPPGAGVRARIADVRERVARATGLDRAGRYGDALAIAAPAADDALATDFPPAIALALFERGRLEGSLGRHDDAVATLEQAVTQAAAAHDDLLAARAWTAQVEIVGFRQARGDDGAVLARAAEAAIVRAGGDALLSADLAQMRGLIARNQARYRDAETELERALDLRRAALPDGDPRIAQSIHDLAEIERMRGALPDARTHHQQALDARIAALGADHPLVAISHINLGHVFYALGEYDAAREHYLAGLAIDERSLPPDHVEIGNALMSLGAIELALGDDADGRPGDDAAGHFARAGDIYRKALGDDHPLVAMVENNLGELERRRGRFDDARTHFERALAIRRRPRDGDGDGNRDGDGDGDGNRDGDQRGVATVLSNLGDVLRMTGDRDGARARYDESLAIFSRILGPDDAMVAFPLVGLARLAADDDPAAAIAHFERALAIRSGRPSARYDLAEVRDGLARALWRARPAERPRARELATLAAADYDAAGAADEAAAMRAWSAAHH